MVTDYASREISFANGKPVALAAVASGFWRLAQRGAYPAGLRRNNPVRGTHVADELGRHLRATTAPGRVCCASVVVGFC